MPSKKAPVLGREIVLEIVAYQILFCSQEFGMILRVQKEALLNLFALAFINGAQQVSTH